jgi:hypothetical protein
MSESSFRTSRAKLSQVNEKVQLIQNKGFKLYETTFAQYLGL